MTESVGQVLSFMMWRHEQKVVRYIGRDTIEKWDVKMFSPAWLAVLPILAVWNQIRRRCYAKNLLVIAVVATKLLQLAAVSYVCLQTLANY